MSDSSNLPKQSNRDSLEQRELIAWSQSSTKPRQLFM
jgi:hypothetical protein